MSSNPTTRQFYRRSGPYPQTLQLFDEQIVLKEPTDILIRIHAITLNYRDANMIHGTNPWPVSSNGIPCSDAAGEIIAIGSHVTRFSIGDKVSPILDQKSITGKEQDRLWLGGEVDGVLASHVVFPQENVVKIPEHLSWAEAATLPCAGLTAWSTLAYHGNLVGGKSVLIQGTGGVSIITLKLARAAGCKVIITSSSDEKLARVRNLRGVGHIDTINYTTTPDWDVEAVRLNGGVGVDIVVENGGTSSLMKSLNAVAKRGIISQVGYLGKQDPRDLEGFLEILIDKTVTLRGINVGSRLEFEELNQMVSVNLMRFDDIVDKTFSFERAEEALEYLWSGKHVGKIVIEIP